MNCSREQEQIARELGYRKIIANAVGNRGIVHAMRGEFAEALACFAEQESISRELGDPQGAAYATGHRGIVHHELGEDDVALQCYAEQERIVREIGDRSSLTTVLGNRGVVHAERYEFDEALACYDEQEQIARERGDRHNVARVIGNRGLLHFRREEFDRALECFDEWERRARELGEPLGIAGAIGSRGSVHAVRGEFSEAITCFHDAIERIRDVGDLPTLQWALSLVARLFLDIAEADGAMPAYLTSYIPMTTPEHWREAALQQSRETIEELIEIAHVLRKPEPIFDGQLLLARIDAAAGAIDAARRRLASMLDEAITEEHRADLLYWIWKMGEEGALEQALMLYRRLAEMTPKQEYRRRIEELAKHGQS